MKLNAKKWKILGRPGMENWEKNYGICLSTHKPQEVLRYACLIEFILTQINVLIDKIFTIEIDTTMKFFPRISKKLKR